MVDRCPYCGTKLSETIYGRKFCPNHGIIEEEEKSESKDTPSYVG